MNTPEFDLGVAAKQTGSKNPYRPHSGKWHQWNEGRNSDPNARTDAAMGHTPSGEDALIDHNSNLK